MSVSTPRRLAQSARGPRAWVNRIPLRVGVLGVVVVALVIAAELIVLGR